LTFRLAKHTFKCAGNGREGKKKQLTCVLRNLLGITGRFSLKCRLLTNVHIMVKIYYLSDRTFEVARCTDVINVKLCMFFLRTLYRKYSPMTATMPTPTSTLTVIIIAIITAEVDDPQESVENVSDRVVCAYFNSGIAQSELGPVLSTEPIVPFIQFAVIITPSVCVSTISFDLFPITKQSVTSIVELYRVRVPSRSNVPLIRTSPENTPEEFCSKVKFPSTKAVPLSIIKVAPDPTTTDEGWYADGDVIETLVLELFEAEMTQRVVVELGHNSSGCCAGIISGVEGGEGIGDEGGGEVIGG